MQYVVVVYKKRGAPRAYLRKNRKAVEKKARKHLAKKRTTGIVVYLAYYKLTSAGDLVGWGE